jgi:hypothetical protein
VSECDCVIVVFFLSFEFNCCVEKMLLLGWNAQVEDCVDEEVD